MDFIHLARSFSFKFLNMKIIPIVAVSIFSLALCACSGRTAENMQPLGETVEVVIPERDVAQDAALANGGFVETEVSDSDSDSDSGSAVNSANSATDAESDVLQPASSEPLEMP